MLTHEAVEFSPRCWSIPPRRTSPPFDITSTPEGGVYLWERFDLMDFSVTFSERVTVSNAPALALRFTIGTTEKLA